MESSVEMPRGIWRHANGAEYEVLFVTNLENESEAHPPQVVYQGVCNGKQWSRPLSTWRDRMTFVRPAALVDHGTVIRGVLDEMRERLVNNGQHRSETLVSWADRLELALSGTVPLRAVDAPPLTD